MTISFQKKTSAVLAAMLLTTTAQAQENAGQSEGTGTGFLSFEGQSPFNVIYDKVDGMAVVEGDIIIGPVSNFEHEHNELMPNSIVIEPLASWPNSVVPYQINSTLSATALRNFNRAIEHWEKRTGIDMVLRTPENADQYPGYISVNGSTGCSARVGYSGFSQPINLASGCGFGASVHEIGHAIGFWHEQSREDRDSFVRVNLENVQSGRTHNFSQHISNGTDVGDYDYGSIMHYGAFAFSSNGQPTIEPLQNGVVIGQRSGLSVGDIASAVAVYGQASKIEAEYYDRSFDASSGNQGGEYKTDSVDIEVSTDEGAGYNVGWTEDGEWLEYDVALNPGTYTLSTRVATEAGGGNYTVEFEGVSIGTNTVDNTGGWQAWQTQNVGQFTVNTSGVHTFRININTGGFNLNWFKVEEGGGCIGTACVEPIHFEAESFILGQYVETEACSEGGLNVGYIDPNDWMVYDRVNVPTAGHYVVEYRVASDIGGGRLQLEEQGGHIVYGQIDIPWTGGWQNWTTVQHTVWLTEGDHDFAIAALNGGWNINWFRISPAN